MAASLDHARAIVAAIALRDEDAAERAMRAQLTTARAAVTAVLSR
jgi:DNA-binding GntR family transcriptional regulator